MRLPKTSFRRRPPQADDEHPPSKRARHACSTPRRLPLGRSGSQRLPRGHDDPPPSSGTSRWIPEPWNRTASPGGSTGTEKLARRVLPVGKPSPCFSHSLERRVYLVRMRQQAVCGKILFSAISETRPDTGKECTLLRVRLVGTQFVNSWYVSLYSAAPEIFSRVRKAQ